MTFVLEIAICVHLPSRRSAAAPCGHRYARREISEAAFTNRLDSAYIALSVEYR